MRFPTPGRTTRPRREKPGVVDVPYAPRVKLQFVTRNSRIAWFGLVGALVACGVLCGVLVDGTTGKLLCLVLASIGLVGAVLLAFLEVGLSEDRERTADDARKARRTTRRLDAQRRRPPPRRR